MREKGGIMGHSENQSRGRGENRGRIRSEADADAAAAVTHPDPVGDVNEHLTRDFARVRAKFGMDPPPGLPSLTEAWRSETSIEEDEAEFVDTVADCLGAGLSLQDALTCWDTGHLASDDSDPTSLGDDEPSIVVAPVAPRRPTGGHRLLVR